jgi:hypothetical protein
VKQKNAQKRWPGRKPEGSQECLVTVENPGKIPGNKASVDFLCHPGSKKSGLLPLGTELVNQITPTSKLFLESAQKNRSLLHIDTRCSIQGNIHRHDQRTTWTKHSVEFSGNLFVISGMLEN